ncbi:MAG: YraN family protein [Desulfuromonadaceae bacterium]|nr:YraN family protein [Desulfuromonadaceae bacterium]
MTQERLQLGRWGEQQAVRYLRRRLYRVLEVNYRSRLGEVDIIARRGSVLAFIEVKTRRQTLFGAAQEAVTLRKQRQILRVAQGYLQQSALDLQPRFDVISVMAEGQRVRIDHIEDAFRPD